MGVGVPLKIGETSNGGEASGGVARLMDRHDCLLERLHGSRKTPCRNGVARGRGAVADATVLSSGRKTHVEDRQDGSHFYWLWR